MRNYQIKPTVPKEYTNRILTFLQKSGDIIRLIEDPFLVIGKGGIKQFVACFTSVDIEFVQS